MLFLGLSSNLPMFEPGRPMLVLVLRSANVITVIAERQPVMTSPNDEALKGTSE